MSARLLLDEMITPRLAQQLRGEGIDAVAISDSPSLRGTPVQEVLEIAARDGRILVTANIKDFAPLSRSWASQGRTHAGIVLISTKAYPPDRTFIGRIAAALRERARSDRWPQPGEVDFL